MIGESVEFVSEARKDGIERFERTLTFLQLLVSSKRQADFVAACSDMSEPTSAVRVRLKRRV